MEKCKGITSITVTVLFILVFTSKVSVMQRSNELNRPLTQGHPVAIQSATKLKYFQKKKHWRPAIPNLEPGESSKILQDFSGITYITTIMLSDSTDAIKSPQDSDKGDRGRGLILADFTKQSFKMQTFQCHEGLLIAFQATSRSTSARHKLSQLFSMSTAACSHPVPLLVP